MNAVQYLWQVKALDTKLKQREDQLKNIKQAALEAGATGFDAISVQSSAEGGRVERLVLRYLELEREIQEERVNLEEKKNEIIGQIHKLTNERYVVVLYKYFVENKSYDTISQELVYNYDYVKKLRIKATKIFAKVITADVEDAE